MLSREQALGLVLSLSILCAGLLAAVVYLWQRPTGELKALDQALRDPSVRSEVIDELVEQADSVFDSWPDPVVSRVLLPNLSREVRQRPLTTNEYGMPERSYALPKEPGTVRVVLLGDSYVFGSGVRMEERLGVHLERMLGEHAGGWKVECLHLAVPSWDILAECAYVDRQLDSLEPDLVVQVAVPNDLDDNSGIRGFGAQAEYSPRRVGARIYRTYPRRLGFAVRNPLLHALDDESRRRYAQARDAMRDLGDDVRALGGRYLLALYWLNTQAIALAQFEAALTAEEIAVLPRSLFNDLSYRVSPADGHWNAAGHLRVAQYLYGVIQQRGLLPPLSLPVDETAAKVVRELEADAREELAADPAAALTATIAPKASIDFTALTEATASQIYGGVFTPAMAGPWVSMMLDGRETSRLTVEGRGLTATVLDGTVVTASVEGVDVGRFTLHPDEPFRFAAPVPAEVAGRAFSTVRLVADDYVYGDVDLRQSLSYFLYRVSLE